MKALVGAFDKDKVKVETFSWHPVTSRRFADTLVCRLYIDKNTTALSQVVMNTLYEIEGQHLAAAACHIQTHESERARHKNSFDIKQTKINITNTC